MANIERSGFAAIVGRPNVGKSTLLNTLVGQKVAIVSRKPQTTRNRILAILNKDDTQMIFLDTPGFHRPKNRLGEYMARVVNTSVADVDCVVFVAEPVSEPKAEELEMIKRLISRRIPVILAINKTDTVQKPQILTAIASYSQLMDFEAVVPISAKKNEGVDELSAEIRKLMPPGPEYYPEDMVTDQPERAIAGEIIREKMLLLLSEEIPHGAAVSIERMTETDSGTVSIGACIYCEKESHKGIIIGKGGKMIKKIATYAREDIEKMLECKVFLEVFVKVDAGWRNKIASLREFGFTQDE